MPKRINPNIETKISRSTDAFEAESPRSHGGCGIAAVANLRDESCREVVDMILEAARNMEHRGGGIGKQSDGAGIMVRPDRKFFEQFISPGLNLPESEQLMVGNAWVLPEMHGNALKLQREVDEHVIEAGLKPMGWRKVPVRPELLPPHVAQSMPQFWQVLMARNFVGEEELRKAMYLLRNKLGGEMHGMYFPSFMPDTLVYKNLCSGSELPEVFPDLKDPKFKTSAAVYHRRYSTNTTPKFALAQPFSIVAHNGEVNTNQANVNAVHDFERAARLFFKILMRQGSDSANLDRMVEYFMANGISLEETLRRFMTPPWKDILQVPDQVKAYYNGCRRALGNLAVMEGPAAVTALSGDKLVASLDKMGLRPLRVMETKDGMLIVASELGAVNIDAENIAKTSQVNPGEIIVVNTKTGEILGGMDVERSIVEETPINFVPLSSSGILVPEASAVRYEYIGRLEEQLTRFGWTADRKRAVINMLKEGKEPITSMGNGRPLAVLSQNHPTLFKYFKQIVAVVTNPPVDPIREKGAFDLTTYLGRIPEISEVRHDYKVYQQYKIESPFLTDSELKAIMDRSEEEKRTNHRDHPKAAEIDLSFEGGSAEQLKQRLTQIRDEAIALVKNKKDQTHIIILSDRGANGKRLPVPSLLAISMINNALKELGLRRNVSLVADTGEVQEAHDAAVLFAHGANAVNPHMMWHIAYAEDKDGSESEKVKTLKGILEAGLKKIMSKMGITTLDGYRDSQLFEAVGISSALRGYYLKGTPSYIEGIGLQEIYEDIQDRSDAVGGFPRGQDKNANRKEVYQALQEVARGEDPEAYSKLLEIIERTPPTYLRDLLILKKPGVEVNPEEVTGEEEIIAKVFRAAAMSHGALNRLAHMAIAGAFNSFGSMSNCGEGGEMESRNKNGKNAESRSKIRQIASGRFGVDAEYLVNADEIQIKIGQGAKPGEGGHLPAHKVTAEIAAIRRTQPGIDLISPPPHHNIYSIEDLAQLIYDLKQVNPTAKVSVKVPAVTNLGTIALGIFKAGADIIDISCFSGGTGAGTESSIEHAGIPGERSLAEVHQVLTENGVRDFIKLRVDGGVKTGMDVAKLIALGANEVSFGSSLMLAEDCVMCRGCSGGKCPVGITAHDDAGQGRFMQKVMPTITDPQARYEEAKEGIQNYLLAVAKEFKTILAELGLKDPSELVGRVDLLEQVVSDNPRHNLIYLGSLLRSVSNGTVEKSPENVRDITENRIAATVGKPLDMDILEAIRSGNFNIDLPSKNTNLSIGAGLAGMIARGELQLPPEGICINLKGYAGQSLGFAAVSGMKITLTGYANDSVGEAMSGQARLVIKQPKEVTGARSKNSIIGNAACYGATGGTLYAEGSAGHRLGVRNSGALIVTEGAGKYAFEYMTGGVGIVLGEMKEVVGAGMTGGVLFCRDPQTADKINKESVMVKEATEQDLAQLFQIISDYQQETQSPLAASLLENWEQEKHSFQKVVPKK